MLEGSSSNIHSYQAPCGDRSNTVPKTSSRGRIYRKRKILLFLALILFLCGVIFISFYYSPSLLNTSSSTGNIGKQSKTVPIGVYTKAAVSSEVGLCSTIGKNTLLAGGSAVDAAIASLVCIGVVNNFSSGIGGGGFILIREPNGTSIVIDFRETAPSLAYKEMFENDVSQIVKGPLSIAIPAEIKGFSEAHKRFGKLPWKDLFWPSIKLAREGFRVPSELAMRLKKFESVILNEEGLSKTYTRNGSVYSEGEILKRGNLASTLELIAEQGADVFYHGQLAKTMVKNLRKAGAIISLKDLGSYNVVIRKPLEGFYRDRKVITAGIPASGSIVLQVLGILERFKLNRNTVENIHILVEALKHGYASRSLLGDPVPPFKEQTFPPEYYDVQFEEKDDHGTTHVSVLDEHGMAVSCTSTVNLEFGSKVLDHETGILFNNEMDDFSLSSFNNSFILPPNPHNFIGPRKRPASSSSPLIILGRNSSKVEAVLGGAGGSRIISATIQTVINLFDYKMNAEESVSHLRLYHQYKPDFVELEFGADTNIVKHLKSRGHIVNILSAFKYLSMVQLVYRNPVNGVIEAVSDPRKQGAPDGY
ncbi:hypothetical protein MDAP_000134 [Mitosporidium daphniae]